MATSRIEDVRAEPAQRAWRYRRRPQEARQRMGQLMNLAFGDVALALPRDAWRISPAEETETGKTRR
jgi:hypothetical protein